MIGTRLGDRYEISGELGRGGMGVVYRARDPLLNREVAVKVVSPAHLGADAEERFQREAQLVAQMDHPAIVPIYDIGRHDGSLYFLMPVIRGANLRGFLKQPERSVADFLEVAIQVADGLDYSHARNVVHRDVKPENIMVSDEEMGLRVRVMDFGLAKATTENRLTKTGTLVGTVAYFAPEQVTGGKVDGRTDIYSLGVVMYECLAGEPPFTGETQAVLYRIVHEHPRSLRSTGVQVSEELDAIVLRCLAKDPERRFQKASELVESLRHCRAQQHESDRRNMVVVSTMLTAQMPRIPVMQFVGREKELSEAQRRLNAAIDGESQFVVVAGEPGVGKSRLVEELENLAHARSIRVLHGRFVEQDRAFSYQGFVEMVQEYYRTRDGGRSSGELADLSDLAPDLIAHFPLLSEIPQLRTSSDERRAGAAESPKADDRMYIYELLARTLMRIGGGKPLVLAFENLHAAETSLDALAYVIRRLGPTPTLIVGTYRQTEIDKRHPLVRLLDGFSDDPRFASIVLGPLSRSEHRRLIEMLVGGSTLQSGLPETLYDATDANPFFTKELVRSLVDSGGIGRNETGEWSLSGEVGIATDKLPATIQQAVEKRVERLPESLRDFLSVACVIGKSFDFRDLETLYEAKGDAEEMVEQLIAEGILEEERESRGDRLTFSSGIVRDVLYATLSRRKRKSLHRRYAEQLERRYAGRLERVYPQLLHHYSEGDVPEKSIEYGMEIARKSIRTFNPEETIRVVRIVSEFLEDEEVRSDPALPAESRLLSATANRMLGNIDAALREAELAAHGFEAIGNVDQTAAALLLAAETAWQGRRIEETRRWLAQGLQVGRAAKDAGVVQRLLSLAATVANLRGEYAKAKEYLDEAERLTSGPAAVEQTMPTGGRIVVALANAVAAREPAEVKIVEEGEVHALVFENLAATDEQGHVVPLLCEKWGVLEGGRSMLFTLRPGIVFHDGTPLTAAVVKASFERTIRMRGRQLPGAFSVICGVDEFRNSGAPEVAGLIARNERELEIRINDPLPIYPVLLNDPVTAVAHVPADGGAPVGTGPYRIAAHERDQVLVVRNPGYWRGVQPHLDEIEFRTFPGAAAIAAGIRAGTIDIGRDLLPNDADAIARDPRFRDGFSEVAKKATFFALFNMSSGLASDENVRHALLNAIRVNDVVWRSLGRLAQPALGIIPPGILGHEAGRRRATITREQAVEVLAKAGGPLRLRVAVHPLLLDRYRSVTDALFEIWRDLGVDVVQQTTTLDGYLAAFTQNEEIDLIIGRWNADYDDADNFTNGLFRTRTGIFASYYSSPENDALFDEARTETRPASRETLYRRFENAAIDSAVVLPLFHEIDYRIASRSVRGVHLRSSRPYVNYVEIGKVDAGREDALVTRAGGGTVVVPLSQPVESLDPILGRTAEDGDSISTVFETLTRCGEGAQIIPWLVSEFSAEDGGRRYRFKLRDDVRFHDGRRMTARDVRWSWERALFNDKSVLRGSLSPIRGAERLIRHETHNLEGFRILSERDFIVDLDKPLAFFPALISNPTAAVVPEGVDHIAGDWRTGCVGTGPFRVVQFEPGRRLELEPNPHYWRPGYPKSDTLVLRFGMSAEEVRNDFLGGKLSIASELFPADVEALRHDPLYASSYREVPRLSGYYAVFNTTRGPLADPDLRRRLIAGIDIPGIVRRTLGRVAIPAHGIIPPGLLGYTQTPPSRPARPVENERWDLDLVTAVHPIFFGQFASLAREVSSFFAERGVRLQVGNKGMNDFLQMQFTGACDVAVGRWVGDYPDADTFIYGLVHSTGGAIGRFLQNEEIDTLASAARGEIDPAARHAMYRRIEEIIARDAFLLPLFHEQVYRFARPEVEGLTLNVAFPSVPYENLHIRH